MVKGSEGLDKSSHLAPLATVAIAVPTVGALPLDVRYSYPYTE